jgi:hypothetical protein
MTDKEQISKIEDIIAGVLIGSIKSSDAAIKIQKLVKESDSLPCVRIRSFKIRYKRPHHFVKTAIIKGESYAEAKMMFKEMNKDAYDITLSSEKSNEA